MRRALTALASLWGVWLACTPMPPAPIQPIPEPPAPADAGPDAAATACERAEARLRELDCRREDGSPRYETRKGTPYAVVCAAAMKDARNHKPECVERIADCSEVTCAHAGKCCR